MRIFSIAVFLIFHGFKLSAQNNLQFNQVKLVGSTAETVPAGKVWKIESAPLTVKNGIRVPPSFMIGSDTIIMGYDSYTTSVLENVVSVKLEWKGNNVYPGAQSGCIGYDYYYSSGSSGLKLNISGTGTGSNLFDESLTFSNIPNYNSSSYQQIGQVNISNARNNVVSGWSFEFSPILAPYYSNFVYGFDYSFRVTFLLLNGNSNSYIISQKQFGCAPAPLITISSPTIATETRTRPQVTTQFPIWIPAGTAVKTLSNIGKLSILEFNVTQ
jgi:hypothetical protein